MKASVLILATRYDTASYYTYQWAKGLQENLVKLGHKCLLLDGVGLYLAGSGLDKAISYVDYVVFYGHGEADEWTALSASGGGSSVPLINVSSVSLLQGRKVYAGCCSSADQLGVAYAQQFNSGEYIGYYKQFSFELVNQNYFRDVVNQSVIAFVRGDSASTVVHNLTKEWMSLRDNFHSGSLKHCPNAAMASYMADCNRKYVQHIP